MRLSLNNAPAPGGLRGCGYNEGIETMAMLDATRRLLVCEGRRGRSLDVPAFDNMEGIDARRDGRGRTLVYLVSDDNNCAKVPGGRRGPALQRTLLLLFSLEE